MVQAVVFDLGNVLIPWDRRFLYEQLIDDPAELDHFLDHVLTLEANAALDRGTPLVEVVAGLVERHPDHGPLLQAFADRWSETVGDPIEGSVEILDELLARSTPCYALSNWGRDTFESVEARFGFLARFTGKLISGYEGVVKPDPAIFELLCERFALTPTTTLFIDDSPTNIGVAEGLGFEVHHFSDPPTLRADLTGRGLLAPAPAR